MNNPNKQINLANAVKDFRTRQNLSQRDLASRLNVAQQTIARWETGAAEPRPKQRQALAEMGLKWAPVFVPLEPDEQVEHEAPDAGPFSGSSDPTSLLLQKLKPHINSSARRHQLERRFMDRLPESLHQYMVSASPIDFRYEDIACELRSGPVDERAILSPGGIYTLGLQAQLFRLAAHLRRQPARFAHLFLLCDSAEQAESPVVRKHLGRYFEDAHLLGIHVDLLTPESAAQMVEMLVKDEKRGVFDDPDAFDWDISNAAPDSA